MPTFVALLRGVNVGGNKRVPMADWRALMAGHGYSHIRTLLNSGNAVFDAAGAAGPASAARHARAIQQMLASALHVEVPVVVKTAQELAAIVAGNTLVPMPDGRARQGAQAGKREAAAAAIDASKWFVAFAPDATVLANLASIAALVQPPEQFLLGHHAAYLYCARGILHSRAGVALLATSDRALVTTRNWATTLKLLALARRQEA